jgi:hypothetical protein
VPLVAYSADYMLTQWTANHALYLSLHSAYSATGGNELSGGTYARVADSWGAAAASSIALASTPYTINVPASSTVGWIGFWDALTSGNFQGMVPNSGGTAAYAYTALASTDIATAPGSAYTAGQAVVVFPTGGSVTPGGLTAGTVYYIISPSSDTFKLSATSGGSAVNVTADGSGLVQVILVETYVSAGTFSLASGSWTQA